MPRERGISPGKELQKTIEIINTVFSSCGYQYWLCFGGLWGLIKNFGTIPDGDLDICVRFGCDYKKIAATFARSPGGYSLGNTIISDTGGEALHCGFNTNGLPHICLSFWYEHDGVMYYCHDQNFEVKGAGVPASGYFFKGVPAAYLQEFSRVEWPGIEQQVKISVPAYPGAVLDSMYPNWAWQKQRYVLDKYRSVVPDKMVSVRAGGATSKYKLHLKSMNDFGNSRLIKQQIEESTKKWNTEMNVVAR